MACGKPSGDPQAIRTAARAYDSYADSIDQFWATVDAMAGTLLLGHTSVVQQSLDGSPVHQADTVSLAFAWKGEAADKATATLTQSRLDLNQYTRQLRDYARQLMEYADKLEEAQKCSVWEILSWVLLVVFAIAEIIVGVFFGGVITAALQSVFGAIARTFFQGIEFATSALVRAVGGTGLRGAVAVGRGLGATGGRLGAEVGGSSLVRGGAGAALRGGAEVNVGGFVRGGSFAGTRSSGALFENALGNLSTHLAALPENILRKTGDYLWRFVVPAGQGFVEDTLAKGVLAMDPRISFKDLWSVKGDLLFPLFAIGGGIVASGMTFDALHTITKHVIKHGKDMGVDVFKRFDDLDTAIKDLPWSQADVGPIKGEPFNWQHILDGTDPRGARLIKDGTITAFQNVLVQTAVQPLFATLASAVDGKDFKIDPKAFLYYLAAGTVTGMAIPILKRNGFYVTNKALGPFRTDDKFPAEFPGLNIPANYLGNVLIDTGLAQFRKMTLDPVAGFGPLYAYQQALAPKLEGQPTPPDPSTLPGIPPDAVQARTTP
ncbi:hypothetical protein [Streptomyces sp. NPDC051776]|uniref:WXG100 family type VII secretion target n=1 Tax=Streptomyces sp. NPDC051776 TaxID=3155414 RepID=UPI003446DAE5